MKFLFKLKVKDCDIVFGDGFEPGVLVMQDVTIEGISDDVNRGMLHKTLVGLEREFIDANVKVEIEPIEDDPCAGGHDWEGGYDPSIQSYIWMCRVCGKEEVSGD